MDADYRWCQECRRAYPANQVRRIKGRLYCAYPGCGGLYHASLSWDDVRAAHPHLPEAPAWNTVYAVEMPGSCWPTEHRRVEHSPR